MDLYSTARWADFFGAEVAAAAALTGLVFVAISINLTKILAIPGMSGRAAETLVILTGALLVSTLALVPDQPSIAFGVELLVVSLLVWALVTRTELQAFAKHEFQRPIQIGIRVSLGQLATLPFIIAGVSILGGAGGGLYWVVAGVIFSYVASLSNSWVLLVEILR